MPIRRSPNGAHHPRPQPGRDRPEWVVAINRNDWSQSIGTGGRDHPVRAFSISGGADRYGHEVVDVPHDEMLEIGAFRSLAFLHDPDVVRQQP